MGCLGLGIWVRTSVSSRLLGLVWGLEFRVRRSYHNPPPKQHKALNSKPQPGIATCDSLTDGVKVRSFPGSYSNIENLWDSESQPKPENTNPAAGSRTCDSVNVSINCCWRNKILNKCFTITGMTQSCSNFRVAHKQLIDTLERWTCDSPTTRVMAPSTEKEEFGQIPPNLKAGPQIQRLVKIQPPKSEG